MLLCGARRPIPLGGPAAPSGQGFDGGTGADLTESTGVGYNSGILSTTGTIVIAPKGNVALNTTPAEVAGPTQVTGNNTAAWNPTLTVFLPSNALAGSYTGTINTSVL